MSHQSVLLKETIDGLDLKLGDFYLDATVGTGGHAEEVWRRMKDSVTLLGIDADEVALEITKTRFDLLAAKIKLALLNFKNIDKVPFIFEVKNVNNILFDLGWRKDQFESGGRGFSFQKDEPLVMTFSGESGPEVTTAYDVVNHWEEQNLADVIYGYGEEKYARRIARAIVEKRAKKKIESSLELAELIKESVPIFYRFGRIHPATKTFQAIRIAVNDELNSLETGLSKAFEILASGGRLAVISFHSLEDRIVKNFFKEKQQKDLAILINKKPITPDFPELEKNNRARSAKLRIIKKK